MDPSLVDFLAWTAPWLVLWSAVFSVVHGVRILRRLVRRAPPAPDNAGMTELAGLPLTFLQPVCFAKAAWQGDIFGMVLFAWWGPGFILSLGAIAVAAWRKRPIDWTRKAKVISWACKLYYLGYAAVFFYYGLSTMAFAFSVWILNDQFEKLFLSEDADRTRRTFDDGWWFRLLYPAGLLLPLVSPTMPHRFGFAVYGLLLLAAWGLGLRLVYRRGKFFQLPDDPSLLRNMVYFARLRSQAPLLVFFAFAALAAPVLAAEPPAVGAGCLGPLAGTAPDPTLPRELAEAIAELHRGRNTLQLEKTLKLFEELIAREEAAKNPDRARALRAQARALEEDFILNLDSYAVTARGMDKIFSGYLDPKWRQLVSDPDAAVLDAGCGHCALVLELVRGQKRRNVYGIDAQLMDGMERVLPERVFSMDMSAMPAEFKEKHAEKFDVIVATNTVFSYQISGTNFIRKILTEFKAVLKPGGSVLIGPVNVELLKKALPDGMEIAEKSADGSSVRLIKKK